VKWNSFKPSNSSPCRFVYNRALAFQKENHVAGQKFVAYVGMAKRLTQWRNSAETPWLKDGPAPTQHALKRLEVAFRSFFEGRASFLQFKRKGIGDSFLLPDRNRIAGRFVQRTHRGSEARMAALSQEP
jgi:putative transposase